MIADQNISKISVFYCDVCVCVCVLCGYSVFQSKMREYDCEDGEERGAPKGHFVVYEGEGLKRYVLPQCYLENSKFQRLLEEAAREYGYSGQRSIMLPCEESTFRRVMDKLDVNGNGRKLL